MSEIIKKDSAYLSTNINDTNCSLSKSITKIRSPKKGKKVSFKEIKIIQIISFKNYNKLILSGYNYKYKKEIKCGCCIY